MNNSSAKHNAKHKAGKGRFYKRPLLKRSPTNPSHKIKHAEVCPYCEGSKIIRKGKRNNKFGQIQLYYCNFCEKNFSPLINKHRTYPVRIIIGALSLYNKGNSCAKTADIIEKRYGIKLSRQIISNWLKDYEDYLLFKPMRKKAARLMEAYRWISETRLLHGLVYIYKYHRAKTELIIHSSKRNEKFIPLQNYLENVPLKCSHDLFRTDHARASMQKNTFSINGLRITPRHDNAAIACAKFVLQTVANNKRRHEHVQDFALTNDSATIAVEVPIILKGRDLKHYEEQGYEIPLSMRVNDIITGHIDMVQIRSGMIYILDYKPGARREKPIEQLMIYALALSKQTGIDLYHFKCAWFDDQNYFEFFPRNVVKTL